MFVILLIQNHTQEVTYFKRKPVARQKYIEPVSNTSVPVTSTSSSCFKDKWIQFVMFTLLSRYCCGGGLGGWAISDGCPFEEPTKVRQNSGVISHNRRDYQI